MPVEPLISWCTAMMYLKRIAFPQSPRTSAASEKSRKKHGSGWASTHSTLSCSAMSKILRGGTRFVRWAGTRPTTLQTRRSSDMVDGNAYIVFSIAVTCFNKCAGIPFSSMLSFSPPESDLSACKDQRCPVWQDAASKIGIMASIRTSNGELQMPTTIDMYNRFGPVADLLLNDFATT